MRLLNIKLWHRFMHPVINWQQIGKILQKYTCKASKLSASFGHSDTHQTIMWAWPNINYFIESNLLQTSCTTTASYFFYSHYQTLAPSTLHIHRVSEKLDLCFISLLWQLQTAWKFANVVQLLLLMPSFIVTLK